MILSQRSLVKTIILCSSGLEAGPAECYMTVTQVVKAFKVNAGQKEVHTGAGDPLYIPFSPAKAGTH